MDEFFRRLRYYFRRREFESELDEEIEHHMAMSGRKQFGNEARVKEESRAMWGWMIAEQFAKDVRYALRSMLQSPVFTGLAALSLALGIGANTAIYSFVDSILLRSLPVPEPESLVTLNWNVPLPAGSTNPKNVRVVQMIQIMSNGDTRDPHTGLTSPVFPYAAFETLQTADSPFASLFAYWGATDVNIEVNRRVDTISAMYVSGEFFRGLRVAPAAGRMLSVDDDRAGAPPVAVVSYQYWVNRFGASTDAIGQAVRLNNVPLTIVGVAPPGFFGVNPATNPDLYLPLHDNLAVSSAAPEQIALLYTNPNAYWIEMMGRLRPGSTMEQAQTALAPVFHSFVESTAPSQEEPGVLPALLLKSGAGGLDALRRRYSQPLFVLMTLVGLMLAIACANIANLLLARAASRRREMAVRLSMGASRGRVIRQLLTESVLLAGIGGAAGVGVAMASMRFLTVLLANGRDNFTLRAELNGNVLAVTIGLSVLTGLLFGLAPALRATRVDVMPALKEVRAGAHSRRRFHLGQFLLVGQVAISLLLLVAAGLFVRTLSNLQSVELGFNRENLLLLDVNPQPAGVAREDMVRFYADLRERLAAIPGVRSATYSLYALAGGSSFNSVVTVPGVERKGLAPSVLVAGPTFFETMQMPLLEGRGIEERDRDGAPRVAVVNELFARTYFGGESPLGKSFAVGNGFTSGGTVEIVGVAANAAAASIEQDPRPMYFLSALQDALPQVQMTYEVRTVGDPLAQISAIRETIRRQDERIAVSRVRTQAAQIDQTINQEIVFAELCSAFALLALAIAGVGLYGVTAYSVARRTGEIGIRMALGAQRGRVMWMVVREVAVLCAIGLAIGVPVALAASRFVESYLFRMQPNDPLAMAGAVAVLVFAALVAALGPARRASRIDPMAALRHE